MNLEGQKFNRLLVLEKSYKDFKNNRWFYKCKCDCGNIVVVRDCHLTRKNNPTKSCGCLHSEIVKKGVKGKKKYIAFGKAYTIEEITKTYGITYITLHRRLKKGMSVEMAILTNNKRKKEN